MQRAAKRPRPSDVLGEEMKQYEADTCDAKVDTSRPCVVRLDGHCFHTYTKGFRRPFDTRINAAMVATATDLLERFGAVTAYTESDEISLIWPPAAEQGVQVLPFNGRVQKVVSVTAGYASARFNKHMLAQTFDPETEAELIARVDASDAHFDARVFALPSASKLHEYMRWRALQVRRSA
jgi:tRNA(His) guanylyltransferase